MILKNEEQLLRVASFVTAILDGAPYFKTHFRCIEIIFAYFTVGENIIATINMRNNFCYPLKIAIFPILREQYWTFLYYSPFSYRSSNFAVAKVVALFCS